MAQTLKVLGQLNPSAATPTTLYTVPASTSTVVSSITVCNRSNISTSYSVAVRPAGAGLSNEQYLYYNEPIQGNSNFTITIGITLATTDVVTVTATLATLSFNAFGQENT